MREFVVYQDDDVTLVVKGVEELAKLLDIAVESIPLPKLWKYRVGVYTVFEAL